MSNAKDTMEAREIARQITRLSATAKARVEGVIIGINLSDAHIQRKEKKNK